MTGARPIRLLLVDDHKLVLMGLRSALGRRDDLHIVGEAHSEKTAIEEFRRTRPDVVLMDVRLGDGSGVVACREMRSIDPKARVLFLTSYSDEEAIVGAVFGGAAGYLLKDIEPSELVHAIKRVAAGQSVLHPSVTELVLSHMRDLALSGKEEQSLDRLSAQEQKVLELVALGRTNKEIGRLVGLSSKTVGNYLYRIYKKLQVKRRSQAATFFVNQRSS